MEFRRLMDAIGVNRTVLVFNRPFPSSLVPLFQNESKCETIHVKMSFDWRKK